MPSRSNPCSPAFIHYALSERAKALLSVSPAWWRVRGCAAVRYEDLVRDPHAELLQLIGKLQAEPRQSIEESIAANTIEKSRPKAPNQHYWQGKPGLWRLLILPCDAHRIADAHSSVFKQLAYTCEPDNTLEIERALANWRSLTAPQPT
jgi:hypothetical protein